MIAIEPFVFSGNPSRVVFGVGQRRFIGAEVERLGCERAVVLCTPEQRPLAEAIAAFLGGRSVGIISEAMMHVPAEFVTSAREEAARLGADCAVAVGGGSTTGLGKAIALTSNLPIIAIPTTYAGSEMTPIYGLTEGGVKRTGKDARVLPKTVIYDPELTLSLPLALSVTSAMNAMAHAAEALYAPDANPIISLLAEEGLRAMADALPRLSDDPENISARGAALYGAWLCGTALGSVSMGLHHKLCHTLGGTFNLPHAETHTVILPHALSYNASAASEALRRIARAIKAPSAPQGLFEMAKTLGAPASLRELGMPENGIDRAVELATQNQYPNPRPLEREAIRRLLQNAYEGAVPA